MAVRTLVTGFEPFDGDALNASLEAVRRLPPRTRSLEIATATLPTSYARAPAMLENAIAEALPEIVLCVGEAGERSELCVEYVALNIQHARIPDNDGAQPAGSPVIAGGPVAYVATLPVQRCVAALQAGGLPAAVSYSAGTFVCNHVFYALMHGAARGTRRLSGGFLHVPLLPQQAARRGMVGQLSVEDFVRGILLVLETAATHR